MKIYLDTCCYCRPFDSARSTQAQVETEAILIENAIELCKIVGIIIVGSVPLTIEFKRIRDNEKRENVIAFYQSAVNERIKLSTDIQTHAQKLIAQDIKKFDAFHIALAEAAGANYLLTVDDKLERAAAKLSLNVKIINPLNFLPEVVKWAQTSM